MGSSMQKVRWDVNAQPLPALQSTQRDNSQPGQPEREATGVASSLFAVPKVPPVPKEVERSDERETRFGGNRGVGGEGGLAPEEQESRRKQKDGDEEEVADHGGGRRDRERGLVVEPGCAHS
jgi:hypothetical protein